MSVDVHLVDGTYELFRHFYGVPARKTTGGVEVAATQGVLASVLSMIERGATHVGVATDHVIESFRNDLYAGYKTGDGIDPLLWAQFPLLEEGLVAMGVVTWAMVEFEADDALAAVAQQAAADPGVGRVWICTPDKDLAQSVRGERVVQLERRTGKVIDEKGVEAKFGVPPSAIPDWLALVGDSADGFPGLPGFGPATAAALLRRYGSIEAIPREGTWDVGLRGPGRLRATLAERYEEAMLYRTLATLRTDSVEIEGIDSLAWRAPRAEFEAFCGRIEAPRLLERALGLAARNPSP
jgi:5'-3' exonuclease